MDSRLVKLCCLAAVALALGGCAANQGRLHEKELIELIRWFPGTYDNTAQAQADERNGVRPPHESLELAVVWIESVNMGRSSFYIQEMAADDRRRVMSQKVVTFVSSDKGISESVASLVDPLRWRDGYHEPDVFQSMTLKDLVPIGGCALDWKKEGDKFVAANDPKSCTTTSHAVMGLVHLQSRAELTTTEFSVSELSFGPDGLLVQGRQNEPFYRFRKVGH